jgi:hypothetical protein
LGKEGAGEGAGGGGGADEAWRKRVQEREQLQQKAALRKAAAKKAAALRARGEEEALKAKDIQKKGATGSKAA